MRQKLSGIRLIMKKQGYKMAFIDNDIKEKISTRLETEIKKYNRYQKIPLKTRYERVSKKED